MAEYRYCNQCGVRILVSDTYCSSCGAELPPFVRGDKGGQGEFPLTKRPSFEYWPFAVGAAVVLLLFAYSRDWRLLLLLAAPLIGGLAVSLAKPPAVLQSLSLVDDWLSRHLDPAQSKETPFSVWIARPIYWGFKKIAGFTEQFQDESIRTGVKVASYLYVVGLLAYLLLTFTAILVTIVLIVVGVIIFRKVTGQGTPISSRTRGRSYDPGEARARSDIVHRGGPAEATVHENNSTLEKKRGLLAAQLKQLLSAHPEDFRIYSSPEDINALNMVCCGPYENYDPEIIELIRSALATEKQVAIVTIGTTKVSLMIAMPGKRLFSGPPGTKLSFEDLLVKGQRFLMEGTQAKLAGNHEQGKLFYKDALVAFERAEELRPNEAYPKLGIAEASTHIWQGRDHIEAIRRKIEAAEQLLLQGLSENKVNKFGGKDKIHYLYAQCHLALKNRDVAKEHLRQVLSIYPDHPYAAGILKRVEEEDAKSKVPQEAQHQGIAPSIAKADRNTQESDHIKVLVGDPTAKLPNAPETPDEIAFLREAADCPGAESPIDIVEKAAYNWSQGNRVDAIRLCNAALQKGLPPRPDIWAHHIRSQAIVEHFDGLKGTNTLKQAIAREHVVRDWEAIIGLWAEASYTFAQDGRAELKEIFDSAYVRYSPWQKGISMFVDDKGKVHKYEQRVPRTWVIDWAMELGPDSRLEDAQLKVNGQLYPEYTYKNTRG